MERNLTLGGALTKVSPGRKWAGEVLLLLDNETGMHSCLDHKPSVAGWRQRQEEASPWRREYRPRNGQARSSMSC